MRAQFSKWLASVEKREHEVILYDLVNRWKESGGGGEEDSNRERLENEMRFGYFYLGWLIFSFPVGRKERGRKREIKGNGVVTQRKIDLTCGHELQLSRIFVSLVESCSNPSSTKMPFDAVSPDGNCTSLTLTVRELCNPLNLDDNLFFVVRSKPSINRVKIIPPVNAF